MCFLKRDVVYLAFPEFVRVVDVVGEAYALSAAMKSFVSLESKHTVV